MKVLMLSVLVVSSLAFVVPNESVLGAIRARQIPAEAEELSGEALATYVNHAQKFYVAEHTGKTIEELKKGLMKEEYLVEPKDEERAPELIIEADIPASFDARTHWSKCASIQHIRDQSTCGSCWAFGAAEAISDRICIATDGAQQPVIAADDFLSCCGHTCGNGCEGGYPIEAWRWWVSKGACTGGDYGGAGCKPYPIPPCSKNCQESATPSCQASCQSSYSTPYTKDKHFGKSAYAVAKTVSAIQKEIMTNGPVETAFTVYEDFYQYKNGVYVHTAGKKLGGHAVKFIGWGTDNGTPYWLVANSWGNDWGEKGFFRIVRAVNECGIEAAVVAGLPK
ncbi:unnamed protein product [Caenorhabditis auriculariae]|uniref:Peptidase C1A papain C-terminal domain-containing protein n=1 Tax=Caenorhabditis auriculariae TaxID=2777116 RepID=A0A8S1HDP6_9PELO|nr:unnamed protein product [Caenorhabditis auriculariae]